MNTKKPAILLTGASGFIGRHFVIEILDNFRLFCIARRSQKEAGIPQSSNITWIQSDITDMDNLLRAAAQIRKQGGVEYVLHLAGYYDFTMDDNPAYEHTNVGGTLNMIKMSHALGARHFIYSSSLAACQFPKAGESLTESSRADADFPYARSKRRSEEIIRKHRDTLPCTIIRLTAVYSDWCENPLLNIILKKWLTGNQLVSRALTGKGVTAMPYIHIKDLNKMFIRVIEISDQLQDVSVLIASPQGCVSHLELFKSATKYFYGREITPFLVPKPLASASLAVWQYWNRLTGKRSLEQPWMAKYIDKQLRVDASATCRLIGWQPNPRYHILRRMLFLTENMKNHPNNWTFRNETLLKRFATRKSTLIFDIMMQERESVIEKITEEIRTLRNAQRFPNYRRMPPDHLKWEIHLHYQMLSATVKSRERTMVQRFARIIATYKYMQGFSADEVGDFMMTIARNVKKILLFSAQLTDAQRARTLRIDDCIIHTIQFAVDEAEDTFESLKTIPPDATAESMENTEPMRRIIRTIDDICGESMMMGVKNSMID